MEEYFGETDNPNDLIAGAFPWGNTPEGFSYWNNLDYLWNKEIEIIK